MQKPEQVAIRVRELREAAARHITEAIVARHWSQRQAAQHLGVTQPRISELARGKTEKWSLDTLVAMLFRLSTTVELRVNGTPLQLPQTSLEHQIEFYSECLAGDPGSVDALWKRAQAYEANAQTEEAIADYSRVTELQPEQLEPYVARIRLHLASGDSAAAIAECNEAMQRFPSCDLFHERAQALRLAGDLEGALADVDRALQNTPKGSRAAWTRAGLLEELERSSEALQQYQQIVMFGPDEQQALLRVIRLRDGF